MSKFIKIRYGGKNVNENGTLDVRTLKGNRRVQFYNQGTTVVNLKVGGTVIKLFPGSVFPTVAESFPYIDDTPSYQWNFDDSTAPPASIIRDLAIVITQIEDQ